MVSWCFSSFKYHVKVENYSFHQTQLSISVFKTIIFMYHKMHTNLSDV